MSRIYMPDRWVIVKISNKEYPDIYKVLAGWYGGFTGADSWKLSSGIISVEKDIDEGRDTFHYKNHSGSTYICATSLNGLTGLTNSMLRGWASELTKAGATMEVMPEGFDVSKVLVND